MYDLKFNRFNTIFRLICLQFPRVKLPKTLQYAETHTLKVKECRDWFAGQDVPEIPFEKIVCTLQHKGVGACSGDSGINKNV